ncbi:4-(cytidine 5'-diphospho)-2-C-methyl-D-erythrito l kinase [Desulfonema ishimotonii]|uniref:4-diphosphocytidyl-2-C-methyl-D-erythritol kinase n=2 Tax=Desulfonema ishimotonii TaxID=45657 RepID=A0A401FYZ0_9BACT|nr:4-(cytidine 5'-diphospho)-2-C-methyl-D-erythrito l kinase [Desulfonema ishimotonii]
MEVLCPAKINLFLHVTGRRPDGYHDLFSLMAPVSLCDRLTLRFGVPETGLTCDHPLVPENETNLAWRAADLFFTALGQYAPVHIGIDKQIPVAAGLGGGSSNAASVLMALNRHYGHPFSREHLMRMGLSLGADVPFFIFGKPAIATGIGEKLVPYENVIHYHVLLIAFEFSVSTAGVYKNLNLGLTNCKKIIKSFSLKKQGFDVAHYLCNDLETVTASDYPDIILAKKSLVDHGAKGALMSGSGPTVFGLFSDAETAEKTGRSLSQNGKWAVYLANLIG